MIDLSQVHLTRREYRTLCAVARGREVSITAAAPLERLGLVDLVPTDYSAPAPSGLTPKITLNGSRYLHLRREQRGERRWTRGLAIAAILISLASLALEMQGRGWLPFVTPAKQSEAQSPQG